MDGYIRIKRRRGRKTRFEVHHWPQRQAIQGYVCSCSCIHDEAKSLSDAWRSKDGSEIRSRLAEHGRSHGRVIYFMARPPFASSQALQREAAALLTNTRKALCIYRVCFREGLVSESKNFAFLMLVSAAARIARELGKPLRLYLGSEMDAAGIEERLPRFKRAAKDRLTRRQREMDGVWLESKS